MNDVFLKLARGWEYVPQIPPIYAEKNEYDINRNEIKYLRLSVKIHGRKETKTWKDL